MWYVYVLHSHKDNNLYIGFTNDLKRRIKEHQLGKNVSTAKRLPLTLETYIAVSTKKQAMNLERYFKSGSGNSILKKRILDQA